MLNRWELGFGLKENADDQTVFQVEGGPTPSPNIHIFLPSGIAVIGIDSWVQRFTKLFNNVEPDHKVQYFPPSRVKSQLPTLESHSLPVDGGGL